jgi:hypothetical protein
MTVEVIANIISSFIALMAIVTLCWQFYSFRRQKIDDKFYELLRLHGQNVGEMRIGLLVGKQVFKEMYYEFCNCQIAVNNIFDEFKRNAGNGSMGNPDDNEKKQIDGFYTDFDCMKRNDLAYQLFFQGIEFNHLYKVMYSDNSILESEKQTIQKKLKEYFLNQYDNWEQGNFSMTENKKSENDKIISYYKPYCGRSDWLGHYFRHLYQTVKFIDKACLCKKTKYEYIKTVKAQLSEYEQAVLFYHACSDSGKEWFEKGEKSFIVKYRLIQHLPLLMVYNDECKDLSDKLLQFLSEKEFENYLNQD